MLYLYRWHGIVCWGSGSVVTDRPEGSFVQISLGDKMACAIPTSGNLQCWGSSFHDADIAPSDSFTEVSVGGEHACGILTSGETDCWGGSSLSGSIGAPPSSIVFEKLSLGQDHSCGLTASGHIACWHDNDQGEGDVPFADARR